MPPRGNEPRITSIVKGIVRPSPDAVPGVLEADDLVAVEALPFAHDGAQHRVQAGTIAATGEDSDTHQCEVERLAAKRPPMPRDRRSTTAMTE